MKNQFIIVLLLLSLSSLVCANERRIALVIGNAKYSHMGELKYSSNDADDMAQALTQLGFEVIKGTNLSKSKMSKMIRAFGEKLSSGNKQDTIGLFYYAGHGLEVDGKNYLIPIDGDLEYQEDASDEGISLNRVLSRFKSSNNRMNIVILDSCRNNTLPKREREISSGGWSSTTASGVFVAYGTAPGRTVLDDGNNGRNGLFTKHILQNIIIPGKTLSNVFRSIRTAVTTETDNKQEPGVYDQTLGEQDFYFIPPVSSPIPNPVVITQPTTQPTIIQNPIQAHTTLSPQAPEGTVIDKQRNLMWMRCSLGQEWNKANKSCGGKASEHTFDGAQAKAKSFSYAGYSDWRVPTVEELETLVYCSTSKKPIDSNWLNGCTAGYTRPTIDQDKFPDTPSSNFWSASPDASYASRAWNVSFNSGYSNDDFRNFSRNVRLVRFGQ
ncbi:MAG: caspase family protein [Alcanivoracaceae bacterium]|nr:caspase family protein [Alcanivoracaceae bacterium]